MDRTMHCIRTLYLLVFTCTYAKISLSIYLSELTTRSIPVYVILCCNAVAMQNLCFNKAWL